MHGPDYPDETWQQEFDTLRRVYFDALACLDERADDALFVRSRRSLGIILTLLGALPESPVAEPDPDAP